MRASIRIYFTDVTLVSENTTDHEDSADSDGHDDKPDKGSTIKKQANPIWALP